MSDLISRQAAVSIAALLKECRKYQTMNLDDAYELGWFDCQKCIEELPSAQPAEASCWGCNCPKMERLKEQKTFSEMVHLHDAETHDKRTETHECDLISRQAAINAVNTALFPKINTAKDAEKALRALTSAQPERKIGHWIPTGDEPYDEWECDRCGFEIDGSGCIDPEEYRDIYKFCPNCGADMRGEQDG